MVSNLTQLTVFNVRKNPNDTPVFKLLKKKQVLIGKPLLTKMNQM
jgi:hypothetical protein